jgi:hypothetical protein
MMYTPDQFSLAVSGDGHLLPHFVERLKMRFPLVVIYDRNEEASRPDSDSDVPDHPKVADVDVLFLLTQGKETATVRNFNGHRLFNYLSGEGVENQQGMGMILTQIVQTVIQLISWEVEQEESPQGVEIEFEVYYPDDDEEDQVAQDQASASDAIVQSDEG